MFKQAVPTYNEFTFQYGSIQIKGPCSSNDRYNIYIPIWFYSNEKAFEKLSKLKVFTFQYGSIQICNSTFKKSRICIYIPIWFYSNRKQAGVIFANFKNLHSNMVLFK